MPTFLYDAMVARLGEARAAQYPGPFPLDGLVRNIHGDFTPMMCGGISALADARWRWPGCGITPTSATTWLGA